MKRLLLLYKSQQNIASGRIFRDNPNGVPRRRAVSALGTGSQKVIRNGFKM